MLKYLLQHAWEVLRRDGPITLLQEGLKYAGVYYRPDKLIKWWLTRLANVKVAVCEIQGSSMILDLTDKGIHRDLYLHGIREPQATRYLRSILQPNWTVVDIGANIGYYALQEAQIAKNVIAIEPTPSSHKTLVVNVALNRYPNIETWEMAVGDYNGRAGLEISRACNWNSMSPGSARGRVKGDMQVGIATLDDILDGRWADYVRMDVEGYELCVLKGMEQTLRKKKPGMFIEVHRDKLRDYGNTQRELMEYLAGFGYGIEKSFIMGRESITGRLDNLLADKETAKEITERGIASHIFFSCDVTTGGRA